MARVQMPLTHLHTYDNRKKPVSLMRCRFFSLWRDLTAISCILVSKQKKKRDKAVTSEKMVYQNTQVVDRKRIDK